MTIRKHIMRVCLLAMALMLIMAFMPSMNGMAYAASKPAKVKNLKVSVKRYNKITVKWSKVKKAKKYEVFVKIGKAKKFKKFKTVKKTSLTFKGKYSTKYSFKVRAIKGKKKGKFSAVKKVITKAKSKKAPVEQKKDEEKEDSKVDPAAEKAKEDKAAADSFVKKMDGQTELSENANDDEVAAAKALIDAYDALSDDQKTLVSEGVKNLIQQYRETVQKIEAEKAILASIRDAIRNVEPGTTNTVEIDGQAFYVLTKETETDDETEKTLNKALLFAKNCYGEEMMFDENGGTVWKDSNIRKILNGQYLKDNPTIAKIALETDISSGAIKRDTNGEIEDTVEGTVNTSDKVFVPSRLEYDLLRYGSANTVLENSSIDPVQLQITNANKKTYRSMLTETVEWWLREGVNEYNGEELESNKIWYLQLKGTNKDKATPGLVESSEKHYVRPMFWVSIDG